MESAVNQQGKHTCLELNEDYPRRSLVECLLDDNSGHEPSKHETSRMTRCAGATELAIDIEYLMAKRGYDNKLRYLVLHQLAISDGFKLVSDESDPRQSADTLHAFS